MSREKISEKIILRAIQDKFGTLAEFARLENTSQQNISDKIRTQSPKFMKRLIEAGVNINSITQTNGQVQIAGVNSSEINVNSDIESLKREIEHLKEIIKGKDEQIILLKELRNRDK